MNLSRLKQIMSEHGCRKIYVKKLAPNDNSKNQVYLAGNFDILNILPFNEIYTEPSGDWKRQRFKAKLDFYWIINEGELTYAPNSQLILYPKYPEVRFSGFLKGCKNSPSNLMASRDPKRLLFLSVTPEGKIIGYVTNQENILNEFNELEPSETIGLFQIIDIQPNTKFRLLSELKTIHEKGWLPSRRLNSNQELIACEAPNCGGYTLEAEFGISPNGSSEPDYLGWELKQFGVRNFDRINSKVITLMTPEPTGGYYRDNSLLDFLHKYGYPDTSGIADRLNFGGVHRVGEQQSKTQLTLQLLGFDSEINKITDVNGTIALVDDRDNIAASWDFASLLKHWNRKHHQACYITSIVRKEPNREYWYGYNIILGINTNFILFLKEMFSGNIYYDPGIKLENISSDNPRSKKRSQFRIKSGHLANLYEKNELIDLRNI